MNEEKIDVFEIVENSFKDIAETTNFIFSAPIILDNKSYELAYANLDELITKINKNKLYKEQANKDLKERSKKIAIMFSKLNNVLDEFSNIVFDKNNISLKQKAKIKEQLEEIKSKYIPDFVSMIDLFRNNYVALFNDKCNELEKANIILFKIEDNITKILKKL